METREQETVGKRYGSRAEAAERERGQKTRKEYKIQVAARKATQEGRKKARKKKEEVEKAEQELTTGRGGAVIYKREYKIRCKFKGPSFL